MKLTATATNAVSWQWYKDNAAKGVQGNGNEADSTDSNAALTDAGNYHVIFTGADGKTVKSNEVTVTVNAAVP